jgi:hypothetical protein
MVLWIKKHPAQMWDAFLLVFYSHSVIIVIHYIIMSV